MKRFMMVLIMTVMFALFSTAAFADSLEERLKTLEDNQRRQEQTIDEQRKLIEELKAQIKQGQLSVAPNGAATEKTAPTEDMQKKVEELNEKVKQVVETQKKEIPGIFNPAIGLVGETIFSYRSRKSSETGSDRPGGYDAFQRSVELTLNAAVDPFAKGYAVINASADAATGEASLGVEEAALQTTSLPWNLELKAGRLFAEFGRLGYIHDHELPMVNRPLVLDQYIGGESRTDGLQINWLLPMEHYVSWTAGLGTQFGGDTGPNNVGEFRHFCGLNFWSRLSSFFELTSEISLEPGISGMWNPHTKDRGGPVLQADGVTTLTERERRLLGADLVLSYKPLRNNQFKSLTWGTEVLYSDNRYDVHDETDPANPVFLTTRSNGALGLYSYLTWKFHRQWSAGFNFDWVEDIQNKKAQSFAYSPNITWATSHWSQIRLQYTYTDHNREATSALGLRTDHAVYLQWAWIIGSHSHGWQQR